MTRTVPISVALLLWALLLVAVSAASDLHSSTINNRPPFVQHVTADALQRARHVAADRHRTAVQEALEHYPIDSVKTDELFDLDAVTLRAHPLSVPSSSLPDFGDKLHTTVYVTDPPLLSKQECASVIQMAESHFSGQEWTRQKSGQYEVTGFLIRNVPAVKEWFLQTCKTKLFPLLQKAFPDFVTDVNDLCVDHSYLFKYTPETGRRTDIHTDSGCLSFTICLNDDFEGGGTWFQGFPGDKDDNNNSVLSMTTGQVTIRVGGVKHCGHAVTKGTRYIIGGFCLHRRHCETVRMLLAGDPSNIEEAEAAVVLNPHCDSGYNRLAHAYEQRGDAALAQQVLEYCRDHVHVPSPEVAYSLATLYMDQGLFRPAQDCLYGTCLQVDPSDVDAWMAAAQCAAALGDAAQEEACYHKIVDAGCSSANPKVVAMAYCNLGVLHADENVELDYYRKCLALQPDNFAARYSLGCALASREQYEPACTEFRTALNGASSSNEKEEDVAKALHALYQAAARLLQKQQAISNSNSPMSRDQMLQRFQEIMGRDNYAKMAALAGRSS